MGYEHPLVLVLVAEGLEAEGRDPEAVVVLEEALELAPEEAEVWRRYGVALARSGRAAQALEALTRSLELRPEVGATLNAAGAVCVQLGELDAAGVHYARASELAPTEAEPVAALADIAARKGQMSKARDLAERALVLQPTALPAHIALGRADLMEGHAERTVLRMNQILAATGLPAEAGISLLDLRAEALDQLGRPAEAFADYSTRNQLLARMHAPAPGEPERRLGQARRLSAYFGAASPEPWRVAPGPDQAGAAEAKGHVFLLGFPCSGTTLLEKVLGGRPEVAILEEVDHLSDATARFLVNDAALDRLAHLKPAEAEACRLAYWRGVQASVGDRLQGRILVDKLPLHTLALPVIAKLFPDAKVLFALRDPRDVTLSCFRRRFQVNSAMYELLTLEGAATYYDQVMTFAERCRAILPLEVREVRHEALVSDFDVEAAEVLAFIGAAATPGTPRDPQLARGPNTKALGQWRRYQEQLRPVLARLEPWVRRWNYPATPSSGPPATWSLKAKIALPPPLA